jgi:hypothetical protein
LNFVEHPVCLETGLKNPLAWQLLAQNPCTTRLFELGKEWDIVQYTKEIVQDNRLNFKQEQHCGDCMLD